MNLPSLLVSFLLVQTNHLQLKNILIQFQTVQKLVCYYCQHPSTDIGNSHQLTIFHFFSYSLNSNHLIIVTLFQAFFFHLFTLNLAVSSLFYVILRFKFNEYSETSYQIFNKTIFFDVDVNLLKDVFFFHTYHKLEFKQINIHLLIILLKIKLRKKNQHQFPSPPSPSSRTIFKRLLVGDDWRTIKNKEMR